jgi:hypothetical protein
MWIDTFSFLFSFFSFPFIVVNPATVVDIMTEMVGEGKRKLENGGL